MAVTPAHILEKMPTFYHQPHNNAVFGGNGLYIDWADERMSLGNGLRFDSGGATFSGEVDVGNSCPLFFRSEHTFSLCLTVLGNLFSCTPPEIESLWRFFGLTLPNSCHWLRSLASLAITQVTTLLKRVRLYEILAEMDTSTYIIVETLTNLKDYEFE